MKLIKIIMYIREVVFKTNFSDLWLRHLSWNCPKINGTRPYWRLVNIVSGKGFVPSDNKPLPEPIVI